MYDIIMKSTNFEFLSGFNPLELLAIRFLMKFEQMIGRSTRLCPNLFGPDQDKSEFRIFDHWGNFEFFEKQYKKTEPTVSKSLMQQLFEARLDLARTTDHR